MWQQGGFDNIITSKELKEKGYQFLRLKKIDLFLHTQASINKANEKLQGILVSRSVYAKTINSFYIH